MAGGPHYSDPEYGRKPWFDLRVRSESVPVGNPAFRDGLVLTVNLTYWKTGAYSIDVLARSKLSDFEPPAPYAARLHEATEEAIAHAAYDDALARLQSGNYRLTIDGTGAMKLSFE